jgi:hypothetical protein
MAEAEYAKSAHGLWVRARSEADAVVLEAQERVVMRGGIATGIGADGEVRWEASVQAAAAPGTWYEVGHVEFGAPWEALRVPLLDWPLVVRGVQRHLAGLVAAGWGETVAEVASWFEDPLADGTCIMPGVYRIEGAYDPLVGFAGMLLRAQVIDEEEDPPMGRGSFLGVRLPVVEVPVAPWVLALLVAAVPVTNSD